MHQDGRLMSDPGIDPADPLPGAVARQTPVSADMPAQPSPAAIATPAVAVHHGEPLSPKNVVKAAKARVTQIRAELRAMKALQKELNELERLIAAAKQKPVAIVRNIDHARHAR